MGLMIHSLEIFPTDAIERDYFIYILDYGWDEPLENTLRANFREIGRNASENGAVAFMGTVGSHFEDEVLSWHHINGENSEGILPAILITSKHPRSFQEADMRRREQLHRENMILIPLKDHCKTTTDVIHIIEKIFSDIKEKKALTDFKVKKELKGGIGRAVVDSVILEPNFVGVGFDLKKFFTKMGGKNK